MINALRAEFRKLLTVRSTYIWTAFIFLLAAGIAFYGMGVKGGGGFTDTSMQSAILNMLSLVSLFVGIPAILLICHEYRYNTISYTIAANNKPFNILIAKMAVTAVYAITIAVVVAILVLIGVALGLKAGHHIYVLQQFDLYSLVWKGAAFMVTSIWCALLFGLLFRNLVFTVVAYLILPTTIAPLLTGLLKINPNYLLPSAQNQILASSAEQGIFSPLASLGVVAAYLVIGGIIGSILFVQRDAK